MAFNHDAFIATQNYIDLNSSLQWYMGVVGPRLDKLKMLSDQHPDRVIAMFHNDPVLRKLHRISREIVAVTTIVGAA